MISLLTHNQLWLPGLGHQGLVPRSFHEESVVEIAVASMAFWVGTSSGLRIPRNSLLCPSDFTSEIAEHSSVGSHAHR
jgi:hypothetical protein